MSPIDMEPRQILARRLATGEIDETEYRRLLAVLDQTAPRPTAPVPPPIATKAPPPIVGRSSVAAPATSFPPRRWSVGKVLGLCIAGLIAFVVVASLVAYSREQARIRALTPAYFAGPWTITGASGDRNLKIELIGDVLYRDDGTFATEQIEFRLAKAPRHEGMKIRLNCPKQGTWKFTEVHLIETPTQIGALAPADEQSRSNLATLKADLGIDVLQQLSKTFEVGISDFVTLRRAADDRFEFTSGKSNGVAVRKQAAR